MKKLLFLLLALNCAASQKTINIGAGVGDTLPVGGAKINDNFSELYTNRVDVKLHGGAVGDGVIDDYAAITNTMATARARNAAVYFPAGLYSVSKSLVLTTGDRLQGESKSRSRLKFPSSSGLTIDPGAAENRNNISVRSLALDGETAPTNCSGIFITGTNVGAMSFMLKFDDVRVTNFRSNQVQILGTVFDVSFTGCDFFNGTIASEDTIYVNALTGVPSQLTFRDCWIAPWTSNKWAINCQGRVYSTRVHGGTIAPNSPYANGINAGGYLHVSGTHMEGPQQPAETNTIGIQLYRPNAGFIDPALLDNFGIGVKVGTGDGEQVSGWKILGNIRDNTLHDVWVTSGASRRGVIIHPGNTQITIRDDRKSIDGINDVDVVAQNSSTFAKDTTFLGSINVVSNLTTRSLFTTNNLGANNLYVTNILFGKNYLLVSNYLALNNNIHTIGKLRLFDTNSPYVAMMASSGVGNYFQLIIDTNEFGVSKGANIDQVRLFTIDYTGKIKPGANYLSTDGTSGGTMSFTNYTHNAAGTAMVTNVWTFKNGLFITNVITQ